MNNYFQFKQFTIYQDQTAMKVGTDGVLLGAWADLSKADTVLDIGTGTGLIALMAAQRNPRAAIDAVEINPAAYRQATENIAQSPWPERIKVYPDSIFCYHPDKRYDHIVCNPPFFIQSTPAPDTARNMARHCENFTHNALIKAVLRLLSPSGKFSVILPADEAFSFIGKTRETSLCLKRQTQIYPNPGKKIKRLLMEFVEYPCIPETTTLTLEISRHNYTEEYIRLTREFYLHM